MYEIVMARLKPNFEIFHYKSKKFKRPYSASRLIKRYVNKYGNSFFYDIFVDGKKIDNLDDLRKFYKKR